MVPRVMHVLGLQAQRSRSPVTAGVVGGVGTAGAVGVRAVVGVGASFGEGAVGGSVATGEPGVMAALGAGGTGAPRPEAAPTAAPAATLPCDTGSRRGLDAMADCVQVGGSRASRTDSLKSCTCRAQAN